MADNNRTQTKAAIKRASDIARREANKLDRRALDDLTALYQLTAENLATIIQSYADNNGGVRLQSLQKLLKQVNAELEKLTKQRNAMLEVNMLEAAILGTVPFKSTAIAFTDAALNNVAHDAVKQVHRFIDEGGLQLSDRLWRLDNHANKIVGDAIQSAVIQGHSASQAALELVSSGGKITSVLTNKIGNANAIKIAKDATGQLMNKKGSPYANALRVFRTEINRSHINAYQQTAFKHPDVIGTRFLLSPMHPETDICDMHSKANLYGLGAGVYPKDKNPCPAHPNTLSSIEAVYKDEVTDEDRAGKTDRITWLKKQTPHQQGAILGISKGWMLRADHLKENEINTPWNILKKRLEKQNIEIP